MREIKKWIVWCEVVCWREVLGPGSSPFRLNSVPYNIMFNVDWISENSLIWYRLNSGAVVRA